VYFILSNINVHICSILHKHGSINLNDLRMRNFFGHNEYSLEGIWGDF
jgi:hypothetical protein